MFKCSLCKTLTFLQNISKNKMLMYVILNKTDGKIGEVHFLIEQY